MTFDEATGEERQVPLYDGYNHHYGMGIGSYDLMKKYYEAHKNDPYGGYELNAKVITAADQMLAATTQVR